MVKKTKQVRISLEAWNTLRLRAFQKGKTMGGLLEKLIMRK